jgi:hypothetical protein
MDFETKMGGRSVPMAYELRDALDHVGELIANEDDDRLFELHSKEIETHLWRCLSESAEALAEDAVIRLRKLLTYGTWWWRLLGIVPEIPPHGIRTSLSNAEDLIAEGRDGKGSRENKCEKFFEARKLCEDSIASLHKVDVSGKIAATVLGVVCVVLGLLLGLFLK